MGMNLLMQQMLGINPEDIQKAVNEFMTKIQDGLTTLTEKQAEIDRSLALIERQNEMLIEMMQTMTLTVNDRSSDHFKVPRNLPMIAFDADQVFPAHPAAVSANRPAYVREQ